MLEELFSLIGTRVRILKEQIVGKGIRFQTFGILAKDHTNAFETSFEVEFSETGNYITFTEEDIQRISNSDGLECSTIVLK